MTAVAVEVNAQVAFGCYRSDGSAWRLGAVNVPAVRDGQVRWIAGFVDPAALRTFGVPAELPPQDR